MSAHSPRCSSPRRWPAARLAALLEPEPAARPAQAHAAGADRRRRSPRRQVWRQQHRRRRVPAGAGGQRRRRSPWPRATAPCVALEAASGRALWRASAGAKLVGRRRQRRQVAAVVTRDDELVALEARPGASGAGARRRASSTAPLVAGERVFVLGVDRAVHAFDAPTAAKLWTLQRPGDPLTLAQPGVIAAFKDTLVVGQGPRLAGLDPTARHPALGGAARLAARHQRSRAPGRPGRPGAARRRHASARARSRRRSAASTPIAAARCGPSTIGGTDAVAGDAELMFGADASDRITAWTTPTRRRRLDLRAVLHRGLSAPRRGRRIGRVRRPRGQRCTCSAAPRARR